LQYVELPSPVISYVTSYYSKLTAYVSTKVWTTPAFSIYHGIFQGDILLTFFIQLTVDINPLLAYLSTSEKKDCGYPAQLHAVDIPIYVLWTDSSDDSPTVWYRAKMTSYHCDGSCVMIMLIVNSL